MSQGSIQEYYMNYLEFFPFEQEHYDLAALNFFYSSNFTWVNRIEHVQRDTLKESDARAAADAMFSISNSVVVEWPFISQEKVINICSSMTCVIVLSDSVDMVTPSVKVSSGLLGKPQSKCKEVEIGKCWLVSSKLPRRFGIIKKGKGVLETEMLDNLEIGMKLKTKTLVKPSSSVVYPK